MKKFNIFHYLAIFWAFFYAQGGFALQVQDIKDRGTLLVCSDAGFLPFEMRLPNGDWAGLDVDMMRDYAKQLGVKLQMVQINFDGIIPALIAGKCDLIAAGMTVTPERKKVLAFSETIYTNGLSFAYKAGSSKTYAHLKDLDQKHIKIAVKTGYTSDLYLSKHFKNAHILRFDEDSALYLAVSQGRADALFSDSTYVKLLSHQQKGKLKVVHTPMLSESYAVAGRPQDAVLMESFNSFLKHWKSSGLQAKSQEKYLGS